MKITSTTQKPLRMALLLAWRSKGFARPRYGLVDDEELLRTGKANFLCTDGRMLLAMRNELLLLQPVSDEFATTQKLPHTLIDPTATKLPMPSFRVE